MSQITPFDFEGHAVRVLDLNNEPWFVGADIARVLGIASASGITRMVDDEDKDSHEVETPGGSQRVTIVNESGMYTALMRSNNPKARPFRRWITTEVLPSIRKRGGYLTPEATEAALTDPDFIIRLATDLKTERAKRAELEARAEADRPKVIFADAVAVSETAILVGDLAKILRDNGVEVGANRLFQWMRDNGFLIRRKGSDYNSPTQRAMEMGLFRVKETAITHSDGHVTVSKTSKVTGKGQRYFIERFLAEVDPAA